MVIDYAGQVNMYAYQKEIEGRYQFDLVVPERYKRPLPPAPPSPPPAQQQPAPPATPQLKPSSTPKKKGVQFSDQPLFVLAKPGNQKGPQGKPGNVGPPKGASGPQPPFYPSGQVTLEGLGVPIPTGLIAKLKELLKEQDEQRQRKRPTSEYSQTYAKFKDLMKQVGLDVRDYRQFQVYAECLHGKLTPWTSESLVAKALQANFQGNKHTEVQELMRNYGVLPTAFKPGAPSRRL